MWQASDFFGLEIDKKTRRREYVAARQMFIDYMKANSWLTLVELGRLLGAKHHASIIHSLKTVNDIKSQPRANRAWLNLYDEFCEYMDTQKDSEETFSRENLSKGIGFL